MQIFVLLINTSFNKKTEFICKYFTIKTYRVFLKCILSNTHLCTTSNLAIKKEVNIYFKLINYVSSRRRTFLLNNFFFFLIFSIGFGSLDLRFIEKV